MAFTYCENLNFVSWDSSNINTIQLSEWSDVFNLHTAPYFYKEDIDILWNQTFKKRGRPNPLENISLQICPVTFTTRNGEILKSFALVIITNVNGTRTKILGNTKLYTCNNNVNYEVPDKDGNPITIDQTKVLAALPCRPQDPIGKKFLSGPDLCIVDEDYDKIPDVEIIYPE